MVNASLDGIPDHDLDLTKQLFEEDLKFFSSLPDNELERLLSLAEDMIEQDLEPYKHPDILQALSDIATHRGLEVPSLIPSHLDVVSLSNEPITL